MITGPRKTDNDEQEEYWFDYIDEYQEALDKFTGIPNKYNGVFEEIYNLRKFVVFNGDNVINEEKDFQILLRQEFDPEESSSQESVLDKYSHKNSFRRFTYDATLLLIHSRFETRLKEFCFIIQKFGKNRNIAVPEGGRDRIGLTETLIEDFISPLFPDCKNELLKDKNERQIFRFMRNKLNHNLGLFTICNKDPMIKNLREFERSRKDLSVRWISRNRQNNSSTYKIEILKSSILFQYLNLFSSVVDLIAFKANKL